MFVLPLNENVALWKLEINCYFLIKFHLLINAVTVAFFQKTVLFNYLKVRYLIHSNPFREQDIAKVRANTFRESVILRDSPGTTIFVLKSIVNPHYWTKLYCINQPYVSLYHLYFLHTKISKIKWNVTKTHRRNSR